MKNLYKIFLFTITISLLFMGCTAKTSQQTTAKKQIPATNIEKVQKESKPLTILKVGTSARNAPFEFIDENTDKVIGFDVDFINAVAKEAGMKASITDLPWDQLSSALNSKKVDVVISALPITPTMKEVSFSEPYFEVSQLIATVGDSSYRNLKNLQGQMVGVEGNSTSQFFLEKTPGFKQDDIRPYTTISEALTDLMYGSVSAVVGDGPRILYFKQKNRDVKIVTFNSNLPSEKLGIAVKRDNEELLAKINTAIIKIHASGYIALYKKYFGNSQ